MAAVPVLTLAPRQTHRCMRGHCWVFRSELEPGFAVPADGAQVAIHDPRGAFLGRGLYSHQSQIAVRLFTRQAVDLDADFLRDRLDQALAFRAVVAAGRPARRLVSSEGDLLPGLIVDQYASSLVVQATTVGIDQRLGMIVELLAQRLAPAQVIERNDLSVRALEGLPSRSGVLHGPASTEVEVAIGEITYRLDLLDPHKTGAYLDQQQNHLAFRQVLPPRARVLDACCHLGGFALHALRAGAAQAVAIDSAPASIRATRHAAAQAGLDARLTAIEADIFAWLRAQAANERFDVIVLDPPSFTRNRQGLPGALRGYRELHLRALRLLGVGGRLMSFSCSHHVAEAEFLDTLLEAAADCGRTVRLDQLLCASADHPVLPIIPETRYLKGVLVTVLEA